MLFSDLPLSEPLLKSLSHEGYEQATPIQAQCIPLIADGRDVVGCAQTGTGKTAAFALPTLEILMRDRARQHDRHRPIRAVVLSPTRELALQISDSFGTYGRHSGLKRAVIFGGVSQVPQVKALRNGVDMLIATPGRLLDLMNQGFVKLDGIEILILDEADRMLDLGFINDLKRIVSKTPAKRQTLLFSATMPPEIRDLAKQWLTNPADVHVTPLNSTVQKIVQSIVFVPNKEKATVLLTWLNDHGSGRTLVFTKTKHGADRVVKFLLKSGIEADSIHGNKSQNARQRALARFKSNRPPILVATDIAARGLDVDDIAQVVNFDLPLDPETYVHRIGRTGRAGAEGRAISFCDGAERGLLRSIERVTKQKIPLDQQIESMDRPPVAREEQPRGQGQGGQGSRGPGRPGSNRPGQGGPGPRGPNRGNRPKGGRPQGNQPQGERPQGGRPPGARPQGERPQGQRPYGGNNQGPRRRPEGKPRKHPDGQPVVSEA